MHFAVLLDTQLEEGIHDAGRRECESCRWRDVACGGFSRVGGDVVEPLCQMRWGGFFVV